MRTKKTKKRILPTNAMQVVSAKLKGLMMQYASNHVNKPISVIFAKRMVMMLHRIPASVILTP